MTDQRMANVLLDIEPHVQKCPGVYYHVDGGTATFKEGRGLELAAGVGQPAVTVDFTSYLNGLAAQKWQRYAGVSEIWLHVELTGDDCEVLLRGVGDARDAKLQQTGAVQSPAGAHGDVMRALDVQVPSAGMIFVGFAVRTAGSVTLQRAHYYAKVSETDLNDVRLAVATTTFRKEEFIVPNARKVSAAMRADDTGIRDNFHMFVVDNGRTLVPEELDDEIVSVIPNDNAGGAGGFARGMMAALDAERGYTHVVLMDDDVKILPESIKRTFYLLRLAQGAYKDAFVQGAMLTLEEPNLQFEDVSHVEGTGAYRKLKHDKYIDRIEDIVASERTNVEVPKAYGAWWFSCIPTKRIREVGLPLPLFVRCDDVEFGMRAKPTYMTMSGICVWHQGFDGKFRAAVDFYQYTRNFLIMIAADDVANERLFVSRVSRNVRLRLRDLDYEGAALLLDGFADYLKGPEFIAATDGSALMKANSARNEKTVPLEEVAGILGPEQRAKLDRMLEAERQRKAAGVERPPALPAFKAFQSIPYDKHLLPDSMLDTRPAVLSFYGHLMPDPDLARRTTLLALDANFERAAVRKMDRARYEEISGRMSELMRTWRRDGAKIRASYKEALPRLTSEDFWKHYLHMDAAAEA